MSCTEPATGHHICAVEEALPTKQSEDVGDRKGIVFEVDEDGWIVASLPAVRGVHSQGRTCAEARANVLDALWGMLALRGVSNRCTYLGCRQGS